MSGLVLASLFGVVETHYAQPPCASDEVQVQVTGGNGVLCAPTCDGPGSCPKDVPEGVSAHPGCSLRDDDTGDMYCGLFCQSDQECDIAHGSTCMTFGFAQLCVYPSQLPLPDSIAVAVLDSSQEDQPHLAQAWTALSTGDGLPGQTGMEAYYWSADGHVRAHLYDYGASCTKLSLKDESRLPHVPGGERNFYLNCQAVACCYSDFSMKKWDIANVDRRTQVKFVGYEDTTELFDNPVSHAEHWVEKDAIFLSKAGVLYDFFLHRADADVISHRIQYNASGGGMDVQAGEILYGNFTVQHDLDQFLSVFDVPVECQKPNLLRCPSDSIDAIESVHFRHDHFLRKLSAETSSAIPQKLERMVDPDFSQLVCKDRRCSSDCEMESYTFQDCLPVVGGGSARGVSCCDNTDCAVAGADFGLMLDIFRSDDCTGSAQRMKEPVKECDRTSSGDQKFAKFVCGGNSSSARPFIMELHLHPMISV